MFSGAACSQQQAAQLNDFFAPRTKNWSGLKRIETDQRANSTLRIFGGKTRWINCATVKVVIDSNMKKSQLIAIGFLFKILIKLLLKQSIYDWLMHKYLKSF